MIALPAWAQSAEARALLKQVVAEQPEHRITRGSWVEGGGHARYRGEAAAKLRHIYDNWLDRENAALEAQYAVTGKWDQDAANEVFRTEDADTLIARLMGDGGRFQVAA